ncbi:MAG: hypothetical protein E7318_01345 [Clostridiales bacterium]|nr:hypothetical protein [Clostridiales bacterium]
MKKPVSIILSLLLVAALVFSGVTVSQKNDVTKEADQLKADLTASQAKVTELEASVADLTAKADATAADLAAANETLAAAQADVEKLNGEVAAANDALAAAEAKAAELEAAAAAQAETAAAELAAAKAEVERLTADVAAANEALTAAQAQVETLTAELEAAKAAAVVEEVVETPAVDTDPVLADARSYVRMMYKNSPETTMADYDVISAVVIDGVAYPIAWTADSDTVKFVEKDGMVTVDVDEKNPEEIFYVLTATITSPVTGETVAVSFNHKVPAAMILEGLSYEEIVAAAYTLEDGLAMEEPQRLFGTIIKIPTPYSEQYGNITVDIQIGDLADQPIQCYRLAGEGVANLQVGDKITVEGILKNYKGTIEFDAGCQLVGMGEIISQQGYLDAAYALEEGAAMTAPTALEGEIIKIDTPWSPDYKNITVTIVCDGKTEQPIMCYRLAGEGAEALAVGDKIAVWGTIKNYKGTIEFDAGCQLIPYGTAAQVRTLLNAYTLEDGMAMDKSATLTGVIVKIPTAYSPDYQNITVDMVVAGMADHVIQCYRLAGEGAEGLAIGDTITVTGIIKNYKGTIEFDKGCTLDAVVKAE